MSSDIKVSIIIPCRNEENFISRCLDSILANNYPKEKMEILVVDGMSQDATREIVGTYIKKYPFIRIFDNPKRVTPSALNIGIKSSLGAIVIRMDAHATYKEDYIVKSVTNLEKYHADNIGGIWEIFPQKDTVMGRGIAKIMASYLGTGNAYYKIGIKKTKVVDTVPFGCYRKSLFDEIGFFNENLVRSQDMEFNIRLKKANKKVVIFPEIVGRYYVRSTLKSFFLHNFKDGIWSIYPLKFVKVSFKLRHYIPLIFVLLLASLFLLGMLSEIFLMLFFLATAVYIIAILFVSFITSIEERDVRYLVSMPLAFFARHFGYGIGEVVGAVKLLGK